MLEVVGAPSIDALFLDVPEAARTRLLEIAGKCPVHKTLTHEIKIRSSLTP